MLQTGIERYLALIGSLSLFINPLALRIIDYYITEPFFLFYILIALNLYVAGLKSNKVSYFYLGSVFTTIAIFTRQPSIFLPIALIAFLMIKRQQLKNYFYHFLLSSVIPLIAAAAFYLLSNTQGDYTIRVHHLKQMTNPLYFSITLLKDLLYSLHYSILYTLPLVMIILIVAAFLLGGIRVVKEYERGVIFRLGRLIGAKGPGIFYVVPGIDTMVVIDLRTITVDVPKQEVITSDNIPIEVNAVLYYNVQDPNTAVNKVEKYRIAISQGAQTTVRNVIGQHSLNEILTNRELINSEIRKIIDEMSDPWGIKVTAVETKDVNIPKDMQRAMAKEAEAVREKKARIIKAEGEFAATEKLKDAALIIKQNPSILELRRMQMVTEVGMEKNTTTIILMPSEFVSAAKGIGEFMSQVKA